MYVLNGLMLYGLIMFLSKAIDCVTKTPTSVWKTSSWSVECKILPKQYRLLSLPLVPFWILKTSPYCERYLIHFGYSTWKNGARIYLKASSLRSIFCSIARCYASFQGRKVINSPIIYKSYKHWPIKTAPTVAGEMSLQLVTLTILAPDMHSILYTHLATYNHL